jgi:hypothetical protein
VEGGSRAPGAASSSSSSSSASLTHSHALAPTPPYALQDHKATDVAERTRIEAAGGFVVRKRVMGVLAIARSFGDFVLKKFVSAEPYTSTTLLDEEVCKMLRAQQQQQQQRPLSLTPPPPFHSFPHHHVRASS